MTSYTFTLPPITTMAKGATKRWAAPPTLNARLHWAVRSRLTKAWRTAAWAVCQQQRVPRCARILISVTRYSVRDIDADNLCGCVKPILDGIVDAGVVPDDKSKYVELQVQRAAVKHFADERIDVVITPLEA